jgi:hypothetical protein
MTTQPIREGGGQSQPVGIAAPDEKSNTHCADYCTNQSRQLPLARGAARS